MDTLQQRSLPLPRRLHVVGNAHIDPVWIWDWREGMHEVLQTFASALDRLAETPDLLFTASSAALYWWVEQVDPVLFARIRDAVAGGRWIITGGQWIEPDCNLPNGESICRQLLYGQRYFASRFGTPARVGYNIDAFGHTSSLPQLLTKSGLNAYVMMRPEEREKALPSSLFWWEGVDGTQLATYRIPFGYSTDPRPHVETELLRERAASLLALSRRDDVPMMLFFGVGDHGGGPTKVAIETVRDIIGEEGDDVGFSSPNGYFASVMPGRPSVVVTGELQWHAVGCFSAHSQVKRSNALAERALVTAETMAVIARLATDHDLDVQSQLEDAWRSALFVQFHDSLAGTCAPNVYDDLERFSGHALAIADTVTTRAVHSIAQRIDTDVVAVDGVRPVPIVVFNPLSWPLSTLVTVSPDAGSVTDDEGHDVAVQQVVSGEITHRPTRALFRAELPPAGYRTYWLHTADRRPAVGDAVDHGVVVDGSALDNGVLRAEVSSLTGALTSLRERSSGRQGLTSEVTVVVADDQSDTWSHDVDSYDGETHLCGFGDVEVVERGPVRATIRSRARWRDSTIVQDLSMGLGQPFVELSFTIDWHEAGEVVKVVVPVAVAVARARTTVGVPFGHVDRAPSGHEEVMQRWIDVGDDAGGLACTTDWKYGYDVSGSRLRITALRSPRFADHGGGWGGDDRIAYPVTDQGRQQFSVRLYPHAGSWTDVELARRAEEHIVRAPHVVDTWHPGVLPRMAQFATIDGATIDVAAVKRAESGDATIVRAWETAGRSCAASVAIAAHPQRWRGRFRGHEVKTLRFPDDPGACATEVAITELDG